jgi:hypothetical protein
MPLLIAVTVLVFFISIAAIYAICVGSRIKSEQEEHCGAMNNPYRIILDGYDKYRIQHYEFNGNGETGWHWMNTTEVFTDPDDAKQRYCELMAEFRFKCENEKPKVDGNTEFFLNNIRIHKILDMSDTIELTDKILKKLREENAPKPTDLKVNKTRTKSRSKAKVEGHEAKKPVRRRGNEEEN